MQGEHTVTVRYFAVLRERRGLDTERIELRAHESVAELYARLFPAAAGPALPVGFAVNRVLVPGQTLLQPDDEVGLLPPLGGG